MAKYIFALRAAIFLSSLLFLANAQCAYNQYSTGGGCAACDSSCQQCFGPGPTECLSCTYPQKLVGGECITCDSSCYPLYCVTSLNTGCTLCSSLQAPYNGMCIQCDPSCGSCNNPGTHGCLTCGSPKVLTEDHQCIQCDPSCKTCNAAGNQACTSCPAGQYVDANRMCQTCPGNGVCSCTTQYYYDAVTNGCQSCDSSCRTCNGGGPNQCLSCYAPQQLAADYTCYTCDSSCATCNGPRSDQCLSCTSPKVLTPTYECVSCDASCQTCSGASPNQCLTCHSGSYLHQDGTCRACVAGCAICSGPNAGQCSTWTCNPACSSCFGPSNSQCYACNIGYYWSSQNTCTACSLGCYNCYGPNANQCYSCAIGFYLSSTSCLACDSSCRTCYGAGPYLCSSCTPPATLNGNYQCIICDASCQTCSGTSPNACTSCGAGRYYSAGQCLPCDPSCASCYTSGPNGCTGCTLPATLNNNRCIVCHLSCSTCTGTGRSDCASCIYTRYLDSGWCFDCDSSCRTCTGHTVNDCETCNSPATLQPSGRCIACDPSCATCSGTSPTDCLSCASNKYLDNFGSCQACDPSCVTCNGPGPSACTLCSHPATLTGGYCVVCNYPCTTCDHTGCLTCITSAFLDGNICTLCDTSCLTCNGTGPNACTSCTLPLLLYGSMCSLCPLDPTIDFTIQAKSSVYPCETLVIQIGNATSTPYNAIWTVTSSNANPTNENAIASLLNANPSDTTIPPMTLLFDTTYTFTIRVSDSCADKTKTVKIQTVSYPTAQITTPTQAIFLPWWQNDGTLLGCSNCSAATPTAVPTCLDCSTPLQLSQGICTCQDQNSYIDLTNFPQFTCQSKSGSLMGWYLKQKSPTFEMQANFSNGFSSSPANMNYTSTLLGVQVADRSIALQNLAAKIEGSNLSFTFSISQDIPAGVNIEVTKIEKYNQLLHCPFLIQNPGLNYTLPAVTYLSASALKTIGAATAATTAAMQSQSFVTSIIPALTGGLSTSAVLLVGFLAEVDIYKYINVPFPDNFNQFCQSMTSSALPNLFAQFDDVNNGSNPNSTIGKFEFWGTSSILLDNSFASIIKETAVLGIIVSASILMLVSKKCPDIYLFFSKIRGLFMWNIFLSFYLGDYSELQLNAMIQLRENTVSSFYANLSYAYAVIIIVSFTLLKIYMFYVVNLRRKPLLPKEKKERPRLRWYAEDDVDSKAAMNPVKKAAAQDAWREVPESVRIITDDFITKNKFTRNFFLIMTLQNFLLILLVFLFQSYGLPQAIIYTIFAIAYVIIIVWQRPYKSKLQLIILLLNQVSKIAMGIIAIMIGVNEQTNSIPQPAITQMGYALILLIVVVIGLNVLIALIITAIALYGGVKSTYRQFRLYLQKIKRSKEKKLKRLTKQPRGLKLAKSTHYIKSLISGETSMTAILPSNSSNNKSMSTINESIATGNIRDKNERRVFLIRAAAAKREGAKPITLVTTKTNQSNTIGSITSLEQSSQALRLRENSEENMERIRKLARLQRAKRFEAFNDRVSMRAKKKRISLPSEHV